MARTNELSFGYWNYPAGVLAAWGARWIWPCDQLYDRQSDFGEAPEIDALFAWLNGGAVKKAMVEAERLALNFHLRQSDKKEVVLYEDERGRIVANPNGSYGYLYVAAWLFEHEKEAATCSAS
jgi:hypothetical protein